MDLQKGEARLREKNWGYTPNYRVCTAQSEGVPAEAFDDNYKLNSTISKLYETNKATMGTQGGGTQLVVTPQWSKSGRAQIR